MASTDQNMAQLRAVQTKYASELMKKNHVIGVGVGSTGEHLGEYALIVLVAEKLPSNHVAPEDRIPPSLDGVRVVVREIGTVRAF